MREGFTYLIFGLQAASIYAVAASGLVVTYTTSGMFNFAHGAIGMLAASFLGSCTNRDLPVRGPGDRLFFTARRSAPVGAGPSGP